MAEVITERILVAGPACSGQALVLGEPISFWGGVDPASGTIVNRHHPDCGKNIAGTVLCMPGTIGSSSASSVLLELVRTGRAPAAILTDEPDAILLLGLVVAGEMGWVHPAALQVPKAEFAKLNGRNVAISESGLIEVAT